MTLYAIWPIDSDRGRIFSTREKALAGIQALYEAMLEHPNVHKAELQGNGTRLIISWDGTRKTGFHKAGYGIVAIEVDS